MKKYEHGKHPNSHGVATYGEAVQEKKRITQIKRQHPWRAKFVLFGAKSPNYVIR